MSFEKLMRLKIEQDNHVGPPMLDTPFGKEAIHFVDSTGTQENQAVVKRALFKSPLVKQIDSQFLNKINQFQILLFMNSTLAQSINVRKI